MPKRSWQHAWSYVNRTSRVNYTDEFTAIRLIAYVLVQSCQPHKHRQWVAPLCHCGCSDSVSILLYTIYISWLSTALMHNIKAYCWVFGHAVYAQVVNLIIHTCEFHTYCSVMARCGWAMVLMDNIRARFGYIVYAYVMQLVAYHMATCKHKVLCCCLTMAEH
jgi:hypothetical protein